MPDAPHITLSRSWGRVQLQLWALPVGDDLQVTIFGGDHPHIGAVALAQPTVHAWDPQRTTVSTSVLTVPGHKEDGPAREAAAQIAHHTRRLTTLSCGVHMDAISSEEIDQTRFLIQELATELCQFLAPGKGKRHES